MAPDALSFAIKRLAARESLDTATIAEAFGVIMRGEGSPAQVAALLMALRVKGETAEEVAGVVQAMREAMVVLPVNDYADLVDTCGTGGGAITTFNISTAAALLAAGTGVRIAKHGNRSFTSNSGSADVLEALGIRIDLTPDEMRRVLDAAGIVFMFAPLMHPALRHVGPIRRELAIPTVMNIVGPLANPARVERQVVGVAEPARLELLADALARLGSKRTMVVHGEPGLDEISPLGMTQVVEVRDGRTARWTIDPRVVGSGVAEPWELRGGSPEENAALIEAILQGRGTPGASAAVILNAAAAVFVAGRADDFESAVKLVTAALKEGAGAEALARLRNASMLAY